MMAQGTSDHEELPPTFVGPVIRPGDSTTTGKLVMEAHPDVAYALKSTTLIGREASGLQVDLQGFNDAKYVSSRHARITLEEDQHHYLEDLESFNHTYLNNRLIPANQPQRLKHGDVIRFGKIAFIYFEK